MVGFVIALSTMSIAGRYISLFLMACGYVGKCDLVIYTICHNHNASHPGFALNLVWVSNSIPRPPAYVG
jgi:hypothetical protein